MQPDLPTNTSTLGRWIGKSQAFGLIAAKCRSATRPLAGPLFGETKPIRPFRTPTRSAKRTQFRLRRQLLVSLKSATSSQSPALGQLRRTNPIPPIPPLAPSGSSLDGTKPISGPSGPPELLWMRITKRTQSHFRTLGCCQPGSGRCPPRQPHHEPRPHFLGLLCALRF